MVDAMQETDEDRLTDEIREIEERILGLQRTADLELIGPQCTLAHLQSEYWSKLSIEAARKGDIASAKRAQSASVEWAAQATRAAKASVADRVTAIERLAAEQVKDRQGLRVLAGGA